jgi:hypothetical protein
MIIVHPSKNAGGLPPTTPSCMLKMLFWEDVMQLWALQSIAQGIKSLAELEALHPVLGAELKTFVLTINRCCRDAYLRFSRYLDDVITLPTTASQAELQGVILKLREASNSDWFSKIARICDDLAGVAETHDTSIKRQMEYALEHDPEKRHSLLMMLEILYKHEGDLKRDIRGVVDKLKILLTDEKIAEARDLAINTKAEIEDSLTSLNSVAVQIVGSSANGAMAVLTREQIAEQALRQPFQVLLLNCALLVVLLIVGAVILNYVSLVAFPLLTGFVLTAVIVLNAFYLRSIDKLKDEPFMELMKLALLKFFAPFARPSASPKA